MKRRNREISIFNMSALDLFASALGAFILLAIVIFPYFPNTTRAVVAPPSPDPPIPDPGLQRQLDDIQRQLAEAQRQLAEAREDASDLEDVRDRLAEVEDQLTASREQLAEVEDGASEAEDIRRRLIEAEERLADARDREDRLQENLEGERRRKFLLITISWSRDDDVDLHIVDPQGNRYYYGARQYPGSPARFEEDTVDGPGNEVWLHPRVEPGRYVVYYDLYEKKGSSVSVRGSVVHSHGRHELRDVPLSVEGDRRIVATVVVDPQGNIDVR